MSSYQFPPGFLWGAATSSYQVEGNNLYNDWALSGEQGKVPVCGQAVDFYNRFEEDFRMAQSLGHTAHRFSLEWSRIQPEPARFSAEAIEHYRKMLISLHEKNIRTVLTLHHFTNPLWFSELGGWFNPEAIDSFSSYVETIVREYGSLVDYWITINEPLVYVYNGYIKGIWPPFEKSLKKAKAVLKNICRAHIQAYRIIHGSQPNAKVSFAKHLRVFKPCRHHNFLQNNLIAYFRNRVFNYGMLEHCLKKKTLDFIAMNYYTADFVRYSPRAIAGIECVRSHHRLNKNSLGWYVYPEGLYTLLMDIKRYGLPVFITENGTSESSDPASRQFLLSHLEAIAKALQQGIEVIGYLWWSLVDNFEWDKGYNAYFGLASVDKNLNRNIKPFAYLYRDICARNALE